MTALHFLSAYLRSRRRRFPSRESLLAWQERALVRHLGRVVPRSPFYAARFNGLPYARWRELKPVNKRTLMDSFDAWNTRGVKLDAAMRVALESEMTRDFSPLIGELSVGLSSGTSGHRGLFLVSPKERAGWAGAVLARGLPHHLLRAQRVAVFLRANNALYEGIGRGKIRFAFFDLAVPLEAHLGSLASFNPTVLVAPPSLLRFLARAGVTLAPEKIISVAEVLDPLDAEHIEAAFGQKLHQIYQATEGFLAATCREGNLHLNEDIVAVEREELGDGRFTPIITDFHRETQPIIRYRLDDVLRDGEPCACGSPLATIAEIEGRADDVFYLRAKDSSALVPVYPDFVRRAILQSVEALDEYVVEQHSPSRVEVRLIGARAPAACADEVRSALELVWRRAGGQSPEVDVRAGGTTPGAQKVKRVARLFAAERP